MAAREASCSPWAGLANALRSRNSGVRTVVEGAGDHCCEYMTGGVVVVLGSTGRNVAAGMTGGVAFLLDEDGRLAERLNPETVAICPLTTPEQEALLEPLLEAHLAHTGSDRAAQVAGGLESVEGQVQAAGASQREGRHGVGRAGCRGRLSWAPSRRPLHAPGPKGLLALNAVQGPGPLTWALRCEAIEFIEQP
jgi:hypothetical protein